MIAHKGKVSVAVALPVLAQAVASLDIPGLQGQIAGLARLTLNFKPPSVAGTLVFAGKLAAAAGVAVVPPSVSILGELQAKLALLKLKLELVLKIKDLLTSGSLHLYEYEGQAGTFGAELSDLLAGPEVNGGLPPTRSTFAVLLVAEGGTSGEATLKILRKGA